MSTPSPRNIADRIGQAIVATIWTIFVAIVAIAVLDALLTWGGTADDGPYTPPDGYYEDYYPNPADECTYGYYCGP